MCCYLSSPLDTRSREIPIGGVCDSGFCPASLLTSSLRDAASRWIGPEPIAAGARRSRSDSISPVCAVDCLCSSSQPFVLVVGRVLIAAIRVRSFDSSDYVFVIGTVLFTSMSVLCLGLSRTKRNMLAAAVCCCVFEIVQVSPAVWWKVLTSRK